MAVFRNFLYIAVAAVIGMTASSIVSAHAQAQAADTDTRIKIVTSFTVIADMARQITGDLAVVESITKPNAEIHDYQVTPKDIVRSHDADLILWNGMNLERWFERFLMDLNDIPNVIVSEGIDPISIRGGQYEGLPNPHGWMSPDNAPVYIDNILAALVMHDPDNAAIYTDNAAAYKKRIAAIFDDVRERLAVIPEAQRWLVSSEGAFSYLARDLGLSEGYVWPINADQQGTPQQMRAVIELMRAHHIPVIFSESTISDRTAKQIAEEVGARYGGILYVDSLSSADGVVPTYEDLLRVTMMRIADAFTDAITHDDVKDEQP